MTDRRLFAPLRARTGARPGYSARRRWASRLVVLPALGCAYAALSACSIVPEAPAHVHYELRDLGESAPVGGKALDRTLLVGSFAAAFHDGTGLVYSRSPGARAYYQFASWSERPAERLAQLLQRRLAQTRAFRDVASTTASVTGEWLLDVGLEQMYHDDSRPPGTARLEVFVRLVDRRTAKTIADRRFLYAEPVEIESAAYAVRAFERAVTRWLDETVEWVLNTAAGAPSKVGAQ